MSGMNHQNFLGNIYLSGINNNFLRKKFRKKYDFSFSRVQATPLIFEMILFFRMITEQFLALINKEK